MGSRADLLGLWAIAGCRADLERAGRHGRRVVAGRSAGRTCGLDTHRVPHPPLRLPPPGAPLAAPPASGRPPVSLCALFGFRSLSPPWSGACSPWRPDPGEWEPWSRPARSQATWRTSWCTSSSIAPGKAAPCWWPCGSATSTTTSPTIPGATAWSRPSGTAFFAPFRSPISLIMRLTRVPMEPPTSTFGLLERARNGDREALSRAFEKYRRRLAVLIHFKLGPRARSFAEVEDLVQETCLRAFRDIDRFTYQSPGSFLRWLSAIADHVIVDRVRYQRRERRAGEEVPFRSPSNPARSGTRRYAALPAACSPSRRPSNACSTASTRCPRITARPSSWPKSKASPLPRWPSAWANRARPSRSWSTARVKRFRELSRGDAPRERRGRANSELAEALADLLDRRTRTPHACPELAAELGALDGDRRAARTRSRPFRSASPATAILAEIGSGGMGRVLLAMDEALGRKVAIKTLAPRYADDPRLRARFMARGARHGPPEPSPHRPHLQPRVRRRAAPFRHGVPGRRAAHRAPPPASPSSRRPELMLKVALAVHFLHDQGIVHRDLKPANILVGPDLEPKLLDFGLALDLGGARAPLHSSARSPARPSISRPSRPPARENLDARSDVFSLGAILYELLTGAPPFRGRTVADLLGTSASDEPELPRRRNPAIPRDLQNICLKALEKDPGRRATPRRAKWPTTCAASSPAKPSSPQPAAYARLIAGKVAQHLQRPRKLAPRPDRLRRRVRRHPQALRTAARARRRLDSGGAPPHPAAGHAVSGRLAARRGRRVPHFLPLSGALRRAGRAARLGRRRACWPGSACATGGAATSAWPSRTCWRSAWWSPSPCWSRWRRRDCSPRLTQGRLKLELFHRLDFAKPGHQRADCGGPSSRACPCAGGCAASRARRSSPWCSRHLAALLCLATLLRMGMLDWLDDDPGRFYFRLHALRRALPRCRLPLRAPPPVRRFALLLPLRRRLHLGGAQRRRGLPRALGRLAEGRRALDPRPGRIPVPHQRRHLLPAGPPAATASPSPQVRTVGKIFPLRHPRPRDDVAAAARHGRANRARSARSSSGCCPPSPASSSSPAFRGR